MKFEASFCYFKLSLNFSLVFRHSQETNIIKKKLIFPVESSKKCENLRYFNQNLSADLSRISLNQNVYKLFSLKSFSFHICQKFWTMIKKLNTRSRAVIPLSVSKKNFPRANIQHKIYGKPICISIYARRNFVFFWLAVWDERSLKLSTTQIEARWKSFTQ